MQHKSDKTYQVYKIHSDFYYVKDNKHNNFSCKLREILKKQKVDITVGDFVELDENFNFITKRLERHNFLLRPKCANIDCALIVCALKEPELDLIQLNRYLTFLKYHNIPCAICFNKEDLIEDLVSLKEKIKSIYEKLNYKIFFISAKNKLDLDELTDFIKNKTITLLGTSGAGKSTLLNSLNSDINLKTNEVSSKTSRGRHTTRHCEIFSFNDFNLIDTPGFSCLKFDFLLPNELINLFDDLKEFKGGCKFANCTHDTKTKGICSIVDNLDKIDETRYLSYLSFLEESKTYKETISKRSIKEEKSLKTTGNKLRVKISKRKRLSSRNTDKQNLLKEENLKEED